MQYPKHIVYVTGIIENEQGEILMIKSSYRPGWEPPGGIVEFGEDAITAVIREVKEETGYDVKISGILSVVQNTGSPDSEPKFGLVFKGEPTGGQSQSSAESLAVDWFHPDQALKLIEAEGMKVRVLDALAFAGKVNFKAYISKPSFQVVRELR
jgi:8-oxo-dGTP pyrophosphatase MutT (NUDIX family)